MLIEFTGNTILEDSPVSRVTGEGVRIWYKKERPAKA